MIRELQMITMLPCFRYVSISEWYCVFGTHFKGFLVLMMDNFNVLFKPCKICSFCCSAAEVVPLSDLKVYGGLKG
jgi:hypothetical protein